MTRENRGTGKAIVLGASMAGMLAARVLADVYDRVVVVERDALHHDTGSRKGVPQGMHLHAVLARGVEELESLFPGLTAELIEAGAPQAHFLREARFVFSGHELARGECGRSNIQPTRALLDLVIRRRVGSMPGVEMMDRSTVTGLTARGGRVVGVQIRGGAQGAQPQGADAVTGVDTGTGTGTGTGTEEDLEADVVVDALGRSGRTTRWLAELGFPRPAEEKVRCDVAYSSRILRLPQNALKDRMVIVGPRPDRPRVLALAAHEDRQWMLTLGGMCGERPPVDDAGFLDFAQSVAPAEVWAAIAAAVPLTPVRTHRFPASVRRRYEQLSSFPAGLLVIGDALCSFNPIYGQGITVAALQAGQLQRCLVEGTADLAGRYFSAAAKVIDPPWRLAACGDLALPQVPGRRPVGVRVLNSYIARLHRAAQHDPELAAGFMQVTGLIEPPASLLRLRTLARVLLARQTGTDEHVAPRRR